jgi:hypothetical protein
MTRRAVAEETKYYDFEIALTVDPIWCEEDEDGPRIDYRGDIRKIEEEDVVGRVRFLSFTSIRSRGIRRMRSTTLARLPCMHSCSTSMEICRLKHVRPSVLKTRTLDPC